MKHLGDITQIDWANVEPVDCVTGGSPCQDLSVAGQRAGLAGERSGLFMEQIRCVKELRKADEQRGRTGQFIRPRYMVWENVPGAFSSGTPKGSDFGAVLEEIAKVAEPEAPPVPVPEKGWPYAGCIYDDLGRWSVAWRVHDAQFWGVPQRRKRIAVVADFGGLSAPEILFERKGLSGDFEPRRAAREEATGGTEKCAGTANTRVYDARGNGGGKTSPTLTGDHQSRVTDYTAIAVSTTQQSLNACKGIANTLAGNDYKELQAVCVGNGQTQNISMAEVSNTLDTMHDQQAVLVSTVDCRNGYKNEELSGTIQAKENGGQSLNYINPVRCGSVVRRLTPLECERLQGFPDGWTDIGEWVDSKGKKHKDADSPRYKALGNSIALPFWKYLLKRISAQYERDATLGSLFDGVGGFPLCWEQINGKGSARWASEIEEFPMAVTKLRFGED